ncbi:DUF6985 domain-containing protein [Rhizobium leguminosarum]|uniref:DUF6985 domain-containing protein n=1 Tax=Rhizobium leguminosarum TaxID=384 RepID=UPI001FDF144A|nr:RES domain-containing protein [Rhizobium leguminosarum]
MPIIVVPYFDGVEIELHQEADPDDANSIAALNAFLGLSGADRASDTRHVFACYSDFYEEAGRPEWLEEEMEIPTSPSEIWSSIRPGQVTVRKGRGTRLEHVRLSRSLKLAKLFDEDLQFHQIDTGEISIDNYGPSRALALALHIEFQDLDGLAYRSRYNNREICFAIFDLVGPMNSMLNLSRPSPITRTGPTN